MGKRKKSKSSSSGTGVFFKILLLLIALIICFVLGIFVYAGSLADHSKDPKDKSMISVHIPEGATTNDIGHILKEKNIIESAFSFRLFTIFKSMDGTYKAGAYALSPSMTSGEISNVLRNGKTNDITFTIPEGYTEYDIAKQLDKIGLVKYKDFVSLLENGGFGATYSFLKGAQSGSHNLEGYLFPATYTVPAASDGDFIISNMLDAYANIFTDKDRAKAKSMGFSENQIIIVASIIEKEAAVDKDRAKIASVIYNRLKIDMPLQMDSTVQYVLGLDNNRKKDLSIDDTKVDSPYNTYTNKGLPPGPICNPGKASIEAALNPEKTKYLYFILSPRLDDSMDFSADYEKFLKDKDAYYEARDKAEKKK